MRKKNKQGLILDNYNEDESIYNLNDKINSQNNDDYDEEYYVDDNEEYYYEDDNDLTTKNIDNSDDYYYEDGDNEVEIEDTGSDDLYDDYETSDDNDNLIDIFLFIATWFGRIGIILAIVLVLYFLFNKKITTLLFYIIGISVAYFFGYVFMYLLEKFSSN